MIDAHLIVSKGWDEAKTRAIHERMKTLDDDLKMRFAVNWKLPHTLFSVASKIFRDEDFDGVDWNAIFVTRDLGTWSHGGPVIVGAFGRHG